MVDEIKRQRDLNDMAFGIPARAMARAAIRLVREQIAHDIEAGTTDRRGMGSGAIVQRCADIARNGVSS